MNNNADTSIFVAFPTKMGLKVILI